MVIFIRDKTFQEGFSSDLVGDKGYPFLFWLMTSHKEGEYTFFESLYNMMHKRRRSIVENSFEILKKNLS
jgi:hypothetical protein